MSPQTYDWSKPQRQSPAGLGLMFFKVLKGFFNVFLPLIVVYFFKKGRASDAYEWVFAGLGVFVLVRAILEFLFYRFHIAEGELVIKSGILRKQTISLPLEKIQGVQLEQNIYHKALGITRMGFDSAGTEKTEVKIDAIGLEKAAALKAFILERATTEEDETASGNIAAPYEYDEKKIIQLGFADLLKLSFSANHIEAFFILLGFLFSLLQQARDVVDDQIEALATEASGYLVAGSVSLFVFLFLLTLIVSIVFSVLRTFFTYFNFFISSREKGFRIYGGLLQVREKLVPYRKIQYISWKANFVRRKIGIWMLQFHSVGSDAVKENQQVKTPVTQDSFLPALLEKYHQELDQNTVNGNGISRFYAIRRTLFTGLLPAIVLCGAFIYWWGIHAIWWLLLVPVVYAHTVVFTKRFRFFLGAEAIQLHKGVWGTHNALLRWDKIQKVSLRESMYQRKKHLATLVLHTAGGVVTLPYIKKQEAVQLMNYALFKAEISGSDWM
ncbi:MAG: PH domain-containing protein [Chitinophagaceae bacterium]